MANRFDLLHQTFNMMNEKKPLVFSDIEMKNSNSLYYQLLDNLGKEKNSTNLNDITKQVNNGDHIPLQKKICDDLYEKIFNRNQPENIKDICKNCLSQIDPYDDNRDLSCNECNLLDFFPFYKSRTSSTSDSEIMLKGNFLNIFYTLIKSKGIYRELIKYLDYNGHVKTKELLETFLKGWLTKVIKIIGLIDPSEEEEEDAKKYQRILKYTDKDKSKSLYSIENIDDIETKIFFKKGHFENGVNPYSLKDYIFNKLDQLREEDVIKYISILNEEFGDVNKKDRLTYYKGKEDSGTYLNDFIDKLLERQKNISKTKKSDELEEKRLEKELEEENNSLYQIKYAVKKGKGNNKLFVEMMDQIKTDMKRPWIKKSPSIEKFLNTCNKQLTRLSEKQSSIEEADSKINIIINYFIKYISYDKMMKILLDYGGIIKKINDNDDNDNIFYVNQNFPYDKDGILSLKEGSNSFSYLNYLLNLLALNIQAKRIYKSLRINKNMYDIDHSEKLNRQHFDDFLNPSQRDPFLIELDELTKGFPTPSTIMSDEELNRELDKINQKPSSQFINTTTNPQQIESPSKPGFFTGVKNLYSGFFKRRVNGAENKVTYPEVPFSTTDGRRKRSRAKSHKKSRKVSKSHKKNRKISKSHKKNRKVSKSNKKNRKVSKSLKKRRRKSKSFKKNSTVFYR